MKVEYPKWIYHPTEEAHIIQEGPVPEGWFQSPADCIVEKEEEKLEEAVKAAAPVKTRKKRTPKAK